MNLGFSTVLQNHLLIFVLPANIIFASGKPRGHTIPVEYTHKNII